LVDDVVITGMGIVCPIGVGAEAVWSAIESRRSGVRPIAELVSAGWIAPFGGEVVDFDGKEFVTPRKSIKVMAREIQFAFGAAELAWRQSGLQEGAVDPDRFGAVCGAGLIFGEMDEMAPAFRASMAGGELSLHQWGSAGMRELFPLWMLKYLPNMPACHIGIRQDARGANNTIAQGDVSSLLALGEAADVIRRGHADVMITGGASSKLNISDILWRVGARLSRRVDDPAAACRPFDADRDGMVYGEGAANFVLESRRHAERRGARILATVDAVVSRYEPSIAQRQITGKAIAAAIRAALDMASLEPHDIAHVNAHGISTREDDPAEARAIRETLGDVPVTAPKSYFGNLGPGSGAVELAISLLAMQRGVIPPTLNYEHADPECPVNVVTELTPTTKRSVVALNHCSTGQAAAAVISMV
jgi:3-oxoacyl-[acyl-carrier-protein] synthase II